MARYAAFLRAINVGGRRITGPDLCAPFAEMGFEEVRSFRASGNVVFDAPGRKPSVARIEEGLESTLGYPVAVFLRTGAEVRAIADRRPFDPGLVEASAGKLQVAFLQRKPVKSVREQVLGMETGEDRLAFGARELYWLPSGGLLESPLDLKTIDKLLGPTTRRTMGTCEQIAAKYFGPG